MLNPFEAIIQKQLARFEEGLAHAMTELAEAIVEATTPDGLVVVRASGMGEILEIRIADSLLGNGSAEKVAALLRATVNEALGRARQLKRQVIAQRTPVGALGIEMPDII
jgi:DNA-binding protein YbaB